MGKRKHKQDKYKTYKTGDKLQKNKTRRKVTEANRQHRLAAYKIRKQQKREALFAKEKK